VRAFAAHVDRLTTARPPEGAPGGDRIGATDTATGGTDRGALRRRALARRGDG
jgi:hypothetical protein